MTIPKHVIVDELRKRGQDQRADFVSRQLPDDVDPAKHTGLLNTLHLNFDELALAFESAGKTDEPA
ncbi:MAG TPA: hypothetical protein VGB74_12145 [Actinoplanes sp.]|jgi:hypothetical protein